MSSNIGTGKKITKYMLKASISVRDMYFKDRLKNLYTDSADVSFSTPY